MKKIKGDITLAYLKKDTKKKAIKPITEEAKLAIYMKQLAEKMRENKKLLEEIGRGNLYVDKIIASVVASQPYKIYKYVVPKKGALVDLIIKFSDWQIGEQILAREIEGFGGYNFAIAQNSIENIVSDIVKWVETQRKGYRIDTCHIFCEGDFVSGDIHDELKITNEFPLPVQTEKAGLLLGEMFLILCSHFKKVIAWEVSADNHGRLVKKIQFKQRSLNNMNHLVYAIANAKASGCKNFESVRTEGIKLLAEVAGYKFLLTHGNDIKSWMGIPYYGLSRDFGKEAKKRMRAKHDQFDFMSIGHWHVPSVIEDMIFVNGCLCGTTEFDHAQGRYAEPSQCAFLVSPKHGYFNWTAFRG